MLPTLPFSQLTRFTLGLIAILGISGIGCRADEDTVDFAREILPILSNKCFVCHGPDASAGETDLRLDSAESAMEDRGGYQAVDQANPESSAILERIHSADDPMPPADAEKQLTKQERQLLDRWIRQGGGYAKHWAFVVPQKTEDVRSLPISEVIDALIGQTLKKNQLDFADEADRATLARRLALTLTGLPPEPAQLARFLAADDEAAYDRLVEELLASSRFGEHQARYWLDAVRYGDTHGLHLDNRRGIYPYRDWVVRAFNQNLPMDEFIRWQLAGDLLPDPTLDQLLATGYVRLNPSTGEGGAIADEFQAKNNFDRVETLGTVFLGMSLTCARCHTHKYDPIEQTEYYRLLAFFNSTAEPALDGNSYTYGPTVRTPADQHAWQAWNELCTERDRILDEAEAKLSEAQVSAAVEYARDRSQWKTSGWKISAPASSDLNFDEVDAWKEEKGLPGALSGRAARGKLPAKDQAVWVSFTLDVPKTQSLWISFSGARGSELFSEFRSQPLASILSEGIATSSTRRLFEAGEHQLRLKIVGSSNFTELKIQVSNPWDQLAKSNWDACDSVSKLTMMGDTDGPFAALASPEVEPLARELSQLQANFTTSLIAKELPKARETRLLKRGEYDLPEGDPLKPGVLEVMGPLPSDAPRNRLGLAEWLTAREHPLVARVLVNRIWQRVFGYGLVRTPEDFGLQGQQPTHPELLDWLAVELQDSGWDMKHMIRLMITSRTFKQNSAWRPQLDDPENRLYARGPSYRLDAEVLRDIGLWASELLDPHQGGEGVKPYQPSGMWKALAHPASNTKEYRRDYGRQLYRRSLYVYWKRTSPHPMMTLFDAPDREASCVRRSRTNTPLQSLGLLNETQRIEMARSLAARLIDEGQSVPDRLEKLFQLLACRAPTDRELTICTELVAQQLSRFRENPDDARELLATGDAPLPEGMDIATHAAWTQLCSTVLASDLAILLY